MDIYWYCQGGEQVIESIRNLQFADGKNISMYTPLLPITLHT